MCRSLLVLLCLAAPCAAETISLDFTTLESLPSWIELDSGTFVTGQGVVSSTGGDIGDGSAWLRFRADLPFSFDSISFWGGQDFLYPQAFLGDCEQNLPVEDFDNSGPTIRSYGCTSYNGRGGFKVESFDGNGDPAQLEIIAMTVTFADPVPLVMGDTDFDADADLQDLNNSRNAFGGNPVYSFGDANKDGLIDLGDLNDVRNNFGGSASAVVPEPSSLAILLVLASSCFRIARKCKTGPC